MATGDGLGGQLPITSGITGTQRLATGGSYSNYTPVRGYDAGTGFDNTGVGNSAGVTTGSTMMGPAIQQIWSKEILFQSMPILRFEQFAVKKTELGTMPGLTVNFMRYNNLPIPAGPLVEGIRMRTHAITANQYTITVAEQGFAVAVSELLLNASFDDVMASASRLLGRNMALYMDTQARQTLGRAASVVFGRQKPTSISTGYGIYEPGVAATTVAAVTGGTDFYLHPHTVKDAVEVLASKNVPRLGETYVCFIHPHQSRRLRDTPEWIEVTKYAAPGNFMLGEIGRIDDVVFIETTQIGAPTSAVMAADDSANLPGGRTTEVNLMADPNFRTDVTGTATVPAEPQRSDYADGAGGTSSYNTAYAAWITAVDAVSYDITAVPLAFQDGRADALTGVDAVATPAWGAPWTPSGAAYEAIMLGDNAFGQAISLPVELRDGGVLDFGREHALAWYSIWGWGMVTESAVVKLITN